MRFSSTQGNIADSSGNLLMYSNGIWIANANGDTIMNGNNLNPGPFALNHIKYGSPVPYGNLFLPWPGDTSKFVLFHMVGNYGLSSLASTELFYSIIDHNLAGGLGGVTLKNQIVFQDTLTWGIGACKHANGRDWWIVTIKDNSNELIKVLLTPIGISSVTIQTIATLNTYPGNACQPVFSPDGKKFAFSTGHILGGSNIIDEINYFDFDRCTGMFSNHQKLNTTDGSYSFAAMFSPSSKYLYTATNRHIYQINTDSSTLSLDTVATYDGFTSAFPGSIFKTDFWLMYLATDHKIYVTSGSTVLDLHVIEAPDSGGLTCNVQQHSVHLPCYQFRTVPNHPNYFLGAEIGSICDTLTTGLTELSGSQHLSVWPNPATTIITINATKVKGTKAWLYIYSVCGTEIAHREVYIHDGYLTQDIYIASLSNGMYIVKLIADGNVNTIKFLKD